MRVTFRQFVGVKWFSIRDIGGQSPNFALQRTTSTHCDGIYWSGDENTRRAVAPEQITIGDELLFRGERLRQRGGVPDWSCVGDSAASQNHGRYTQNHIPHIVPR
jgi:hypothetical protein